MAKEGPVEETIVSSATSTPSSNPLLKDLQNHFTPRYAARWRVIGTQLGLPSGTLDIIEYDNYHKAEPCFNAVLEKWLEVDNSASVEKLLKTIESPALSSDRAMSSATSIPLLKDLQNHFIPHYAARWRVIGMQLGLISGTLDIIEHDNHHKAEPCCDAMLKKWLEVDNSASWEKLFKIIEPPALSSDRAAFHHNVVLEKYPEVDISAGVEKFAVSSGQEDTKAVGKFSETVRSIQTQFPLDMDTWPPDKPKDFTPLLLVHHQGVIDDLTMSKNRDYNRHQLDRHDSSQEVADTSKTTYEIADILASLEENSKPEFILVEGLPGIGKSTLLQEISYRWSKQKLPVLEKFNVVLLVQLRSPGVQQASYINNLFELFIKRYHRAAEIAASCSEYFFKNAGKDLLFLFDGFDELPENLQKDGLIADVLNRRVLPQCGLVVSSRPHASLMFRQQATVTVNILGFADEQRRLFIKKSLVGHPKRVTELTKYLASHPTINSLCYNPFIMVALLYVYSQKISLPINSVELYHSFIILTVCRHLAKSGSPLETTISDLAQIPEPCNTIIKQLAMLSLKGLNNNKLTFTLEEVKTVCPEITVIPGAKNGFGLLNAIQHHDMTVNTMTFEFLHFSVQEFLAAYYITHLPVDEELMVLKKKFWSSIHANMFSIYTTLTKGQRPAFKQFLQQPSFLEPFRQLFSCGIRDNVLISSRFLNNQIKCFHLFRCFYELGDKEICQSIENAKCFHNGEIDLEAIKLSPHDLECVALFLTCSSHKQWKKLCLCYCYIQDHGLLVLQRDLSSSNVTIKELDLLYNGLTKLSSSFISDLVIHCRVESLWITGNHTIGEDSALYNMLTDHSSMLVRLGMGYVNLSSSSASVLFTELAKGNKLQWLYIDKNNIDDEACNTIAASLKDNTSLLKLWIKDNQISAVAAQQLVQALHNNSTLQFLRLPEYPEDVEKSLQEEININRESRECQVKLNIRFS